MNSFPPASLTNLELMLLSVHNNSCDLLVHEDQNGGQESWHYSNNGRPPWVSCNIECQPQRILCWCHQWLYSHKNKSNTKNDMSNNTILPLKNGISQPRPSQVGLNSPGTSNFGVWMPTAKSKKLMARIAMITAKSLMNCRTWKER